FFFFFSSRRRHTRWPRDWSSDVCSSDLWLVERRLSDVSARLKRLRGELQVIDEQLLFFDDAADETRLRALMSETPLADREHHERSEERRVGKEGRSRWSPYHEKQKKRKT